MGLARFASSSPGGVAKFSREGTEASARSAICSVLAMLASGGAWLNMTIERNQGFAGIDFGKCSIQKRGLLKKHRVWTVEIRTEVPPRKKYCFGFIDERGKRASMIG